MNPLSPLFLSLSANANQADAVVLDRAGTLTEDQPQLLAVMGPVRWAIDSCALWGLLSNPFSSLHNHRM